MTKPAAVQEQMKPTVDRTMTKFEAFCDGLPEDERLVLASVLDAVAGAHEGASDAFGYMISREFAAFIKKEMATDLWVKSIVDKLYPPSRGS